MFRPEPRTHGDQAFVVRATATLHLFCCAGVHAFTRRWRFGIVAKIWCATPYQKCRFLYFKLKPVCAPKTYMMLMQIKTTAYLSYQVGVCNVVTFSW